MEQAIENQSSSLGRLFTLGVSCVVWLTFFIWYWARIPGMEEYLLQHRQEHVVFDFLSSTYPWGGAALIVSALLFLLTENVRKQTEAYKTSINVLWSILGLWLFFYLQSLLPRTLQGLT